jgi:hypothetical protein
MDRFRMLTSGIDYIMDEFKILSPNMHFTPSWTTFNSLRPILYVHMYTIIDVFQLLVPGTWLHHGQILAACVWCFMYKHDGQISTMYLHPALDSVIDEFRLLTTSWTDYSYLHPAPDSIMDRFQLLTIVTWLHHGKIFNFLRPVLDCITDEFKLLTHGTFNTYVPTSSWTDIRSLRTPGALLHHLGRISTVVLFFDGNFLKQFRIQRGETVVSYASLPKRTLLYICT